MPRRANPRQYRPDVKVGDTIWWFDGNHRVYSRDSSRPVWRQHWRPRVIIGETDRSWLIEPSWRPRKVPKVNPPAEWAFSEAEIDQQAWVEENAHRIAHLVGVCRRYDVLKEVAKVIGWREPPKAGRSV